MPKLYDNKPRMRQWTDFVITKEEGYEMRGFWTGSDVLLGCARTYSLI